MRKRIQKIGALSVALMMMVSFHAFAEEQRFSDAPSGHWAYSYIQSLVEDGVLNGYEDGSFRPEKEVNRAEWTKMLYAIDGSEPIFFTEPEFSDVEEDDWYAWYIPTVSDYMDVTETKEGALFRPQEPASRETVAASVVRFFGFDRAKSGLTSLNKLSDADTISEANKPYVAVAVDMGIVTGFDDGSFRGKDTLTRAQAATILYKAWRASFAKNYVGETSDGVPNGYGIYTCGNGAKYEGNFQNGRMNGFGKYTGADGGYYEGTFQNSAANGEGTYYFADGGRYEGTWKTRKDGDGTTYYEDGAIYKGNYKNGEKSGTGTFRWAEGDKYTGEWANDLMNGQGVFEYANGDRYEGEFQDAHRCGIGTYYFVDGTKYIGEWKDDLMEGQGVVYFPDGEWFEGAFQEGSPNGYGIDHYPDGTIEEGNWVNGELEE